MQQPVEVEQWPDCLALASKTWLELKDYVLSPQLAFIPLLKFLPHHNIGSAVPRFSPV